MAHKIVVVGFDDSKDGKGGLWGVVGMGFDDTHDGRGGGTRGVLGMGFLSSFVGSPNGDNKEVLNTNVIVQINTDVQSDVDEINQEAILDAVSDMFTSHGVVSKAKVLTLRIYDSLSGYDINGLLDEMSSKTAMILTYWNVDEHSGMLPSEVLEDISSP
jgi:hypothetical protein